MFKMTLEILDFALMILTWIIIVQAILSWLVGFNVISRYNEFVATLWTALDRITRPIYDPIRRIMPDTGPLDLTPLAVLLILFVLRNIVISGLLQQLANASL
ncbi:MAG: YggT family protein [Sphingomonas sp.]|uniref:YggT family protein n=1 Tax=Sphingomonas sp. TaxID=28214 RepID=UPI0025D2B1B1|nr:YggT family protein [Sphingomonas sp.]MBX3565799.1 YggT family protein [Sphingomonas sp.]